MIQVVHHITGRVRLRIPAARRSARLEAAIADRLAETPGIDRVRIRRISGSVLVFCSKGQTPGDIVAAIEAALAIASDPAAATRPPSAETPPDRWHLQDAPAVVTVLNTVVDTGLTAGEAARRQVLHGPNLIPGTVSRSSAAIVRGQVLSLPLVTIAAAALLAAAGGAVAAGGLTLAVGLVNAAIGVVTEIRAERTLDRIRVAVELKADVLRDGTIAEIPFADFVPGDVLVLHSGTRVPADARIVTAEHLLVDEATLTGESIPVVKSPAAMTLRQATVSQQRNMVFRGTLVVQGVGRALVVATGGKTVIGRLQRFLGAVVPPEAVIAGDLRRMTLRLVRLGTAASVVFTAVALLRGMGVAAAVPAILTIMAVAIPSGLSTVAVSAFALGHHDLRGHRILVRRLRALSNLASIQVVCFDKTGTLTCNRMQATAASTAAANVSFDPRPGRDTAQVAAALSHPDIRWLIRIGVLCNSLAAVDPSGDPSLEGSSTEQALLDLARRIAMDPDALIAAHPLLESAWRTETRHLMATRHGGDRGRVLIAVKGNPAEVLERCRGYRRQGRRAVLDDATREWIEAENDRMAGAGLRVLGMAYRWMAASRSPADLGAVAGLTWAGLVGIADPLRPGAKRLVRSLQRAGIRTVVITGDQSLTAQHIGERLNIGGPEPLQILDAADIRALGRNGLASVVTRGHVFARLSPAQKLDVIQAYQGMGLNVAMVGDGFNDVLALKAADVGFAMGRSGAELARKTADLVLENDDLGAIGAAIGEGRTFYEKVRRSMRFLLTGSQIDLATEVAAQSGLTSVGLGAWQALWANLVCLALAADPLTADPMTAPPRPTGAPLLDEADLTGAVRDALDVITAAATAGGYGLLRYGPGTRATEVFLQTVAAGNLLSAAPVARSAPIAAPENRRRRWLAATLATALGGNLIVWLARGARPLDILVAGLVILGGRCLRRGFRL